MSEDKIQERIRGIFEMSSPPHLAAMTALVVEIQELAAQDDQDAAHYRHLIDLAQASGFESLTAAITEAVNNRRRRV